VRRSKARARRDALKTVNNNLLADSHGMIRLEIERSQIGTER
jgi:hypothetical protein